MSEQKSPEDIQDWSAETYIDPKLAEGPPAGALIDKDPVCRGCMTVAEGIAMRRGFVDPISAKDAAEQVYVCSRCGNRVLVAA
jgi:hypothetical protein